MKILNKEVDYIHSLVNNSCNEDKINLSFNANDGLYRLTGSIVPCVRLTSRNSNELINIRFNDFISMGQKIKNCSSFGYIIEDGAQNYDDLSSRGYDQIDQIVSLIIEQNKNYVLFHVSLSGYENDKEYKPAFDSHTFKISIDAFQLFEDVVLNIINTEIETYHLIKRELFLLPPDLRDKLKLMTSTYTRDIAYYLRDLENKRDLSKKHEFYNSCEKINLIANIKGLHSVNINTSVFFTTGDFSMPDMFSLTTEDFLLIGDALDRSNHYNYYGKSNFKESKEKKYMHIHFKRLIESIYIKVDFSNNKGNDTGDCYFEMEIKKKDFNQLYQVIKNGLICSSDKK